MTLNAFIMNKSLVTMTIAAALLLPLAVAQTTPEPAPPAPKHRATAPRAQNTPVPPEAPEPPEPPEPPRAMTMVMTGSGAYLGVDTREITADRVSALKLKEERGVEITLVDQDAPAGKAGLKAHDVILSFNGQNVESQEQLRRLIREMPPGRTVELGISRDGQPMTVKVQLADRKRVVAHAPRASREFNFVPRIPDIDFDVPIMMTLSRRNGITVENLTPQLREFFGVKADEGILVRSVEKASSGDTAGLKAGDVIIRVGNERVNDVGDWNRLLRRQKGGTASVAIVRDRREQTISIKLPERRSPDSSEMRFSFPEFHLEMEQLQNELQRIQPQVQKSVELAQSRVQSELANHRQEMLTVQREMRRLGPQIQQQVQREMERLQRELRIELQDQQ